MRNRAVAVRPSWVPGIGNQCEGLRNDRLCATERVAHAGDAHRVRDQGRSSSLMNHAPVALRCHSESCFSASFLATP